MRLSNKSYDYGKIVPSSNRIYSFCDFEEVVRFYRDYVNDNKSWERISFCFNLSYSVSYSTNDICKNIESYLSL